MASSTNTGRCRLPLTTYSCGPGAPVARVAVLAPPARADQIKVTTAYTQECNHILSLWLYAPGPYSSLPVLLGPKTVHKGVPSTAAHGLTLTTFPLRNAGTAFTSFNNCEVKCRWITPGCVLRIQSSPSPLSSCHLLHIYCTYTHLLLAAGLDPSVCEVLCMSLCSGQSQC